MFPLIFFSLQHTWPNDTRWIRNFLKWPVNLMDLAPSDHQFHTCSNRDLSDVGWLRYNRAFDDSPGDTCLHEGALIKIGRAK